MKAEFDKLDIKKLVNIPTNLNDLKTKVDDLDVGELKAVPIDLKNLSDVVKNEGVQNTKFNTLKKKSKILETRKFLMRLVYFTLNNAIQINKI